MKGKWVQPGVPHRGWDLVGYEDVGAPGRVTCHMCEHQHPRYLYEMQHPHHPDVLRVGGDCAEAMALRFTGDLVRDTGPATPETRSLARMVLHEAERLLGPEAVERVREAVERGKKVSVQTAILLARALHQAEQRQSPSKHLPLEALRGLIDLRGDAPRAMVEEAQPEDLVLIEEMLTASQRRSVEKIRLECEQRAVEQHARDERRDAAQRQQAEERKAWAMPIRSLCERVYRIQVRRRPRRKADLTRICGTVCRVAETPGEYLTRLQWQEFTQECKSAGVSVDRDLFSPIIRFDQPLR